MVEMHRIMEPDGPNTPEQLLAVARTYYLDQLLALGLTPEEVVDRWDAMPAAHRAVWVERVRAMTNTANAHWGRHVRRHQAELLRVEASYQGTLTALAIIIAGANGDAVEAARTLMEILELPE